MLSKRFCNMDTILTRTSLSTRPGVIRTMRAELWRAERDVGLPLPGPSFVINEKLKILNIWTSRWCTRWRTLCLLVPLDMCSRTSRNTPEWMGQHRCGFALRACAFFTASSSSTSVIWSKFCCLPPSVAAPCCQPTASVKSVMCLRSCSAVKKTLHTVKYSMLGQV